MLTFLVGGARSGKSTLAVQMGEHHGGNVTFVATAEPFDDDLRERIAEGTTRRRDLARRPVEHAESSDDRSIGQGDRVVILMENRGEFLEVLFACWSAGLCAVPVNAKLHAREVAFILENSGARLLLITSDLAGTAGEAVAGLSPQPEVLEAGGVPLAAIPPERGTHRKAVPAADTRMSSAKPSSATTRIGPLTPLDDERPANSAPPAATAAASKATSPSSTPAPASPTGTATSKRKSSPASPTAPCWVERFSWVRTAPFGFPVVPLV